MAIDIEFIREHIDNGLYDLTIHADNERLDDGLTISELEYALSDCDVLEGYADNPRGESCLALGYITNRLPVHVVCGRTKQNKLLLITLYIPKMPKWRNGRTRNK